MKKVLLLVLVAALISPALFAAPSDDEVSQSFQAVFAVYGAIFLTSMMGATVPGATMDIDMDSETSLMKLDNVETAPLFAGIGAALDGSGDMPEVNFSHISGTFATTSNSDMDINVQLKGGPVSRLSASVKGEDLVSLDADGKSYLYLENLMGME